MINWIFLRVFWANDWVLGNDLVLENDYLILENDYLILENDYLMLENDYLILENDYLSLENDSILENDLISGKLCNLCPRDRHIALPRLPIAVLPPRCIGSRYFRSPTP